MVAPPATPAPVSTRGDITRVIELNYQPLDSWTYGGLYLVELEDGTFLCRRGIEITEDLAKFEVA